MSDQYFKRTAGMREYYEAMLAERGTGKVVANLESAKDKTEYALRYLECALSRAEVGEVRNARLLAEVAERSFLRAFLYIRNALEDAKDNEKDR